MKTILTSLILAATVIGASAEVSYRVEIKNIVPQIQQTPQFQVSGPKDKKSDDRYWLEIEAELEVEATDRVSFIPEITAEWSAIIIDTMTDKTKPKPIMLKGKVTFRDIRTKGKKVFISAYISPDTLEKLTGKDRPSEKDVEAIALVISGAGIVKDKKEHADGLQKATAQEELKWWNTTKYPILDGTIIAKSKTPFAPLWTDRYSIEKPEN